MHADQWDRYHDGTEAGDTEAEVGESSELADVDDAQRRPSQRKSFVVPKVVRQ